MASKSKAKKVQIEYPPVPLRKWKPPHKPHHADPQNRKEMSRKPEFPHSEKLHPSTLDKVWHKYKMISKRCAVLYGSHAQSDLKFPVKVRGKQGPANCFVAIGFSKCKEMQNWEEKSLNLILDIGNKLYHQSVRLNKATCTCASPKEVIAFPTSNVHTKQLTLLFLAGSQYILYRSNKHGSRHRE